MEITNLKTDDEKLTNLHKHDTMREGASNIADSFVISEIRQAVKNIDRVNVFVNGKYSFSLDLTQVVDLKLKVGMKVTAEQIEEYKKVSEFGKLYQRTLEWVLTRPHSIRETRDYLRRRQIRKGFFDEDIELVISRLIERKYLDDRKFAEFFVENRFLNKGVSQKRLKQELMKKGISRGLIDEVMKGNFRDEEVEIKKIIAKKRAKYDDEKLIQYLVRQGFDFELARNSVCEMD